MSSVIDLNAEVFSQSESTGLKKRLMVLTYGLISYVVGCVGLFWLILGFGGLAPVGLSNSQTESFAGTLFINIGLITLFGLQHSLMARARFKQWLTRYIPQAAERSTFMLMSGVVSITAVVFWQAMPGTVWSVENSAAQIILWTVYALAWSYLLLATFVTNHFELMGLRQVYLYFRQRPYTKLPFTNKLMYRYSRHPMMLGILVGMWSVPVMGMAHMTMAILFSLYVFIGIFFEERDLIAGFGDQYRRYKKQIATFIPGVY